MATPADNVVALTGNPLIDGLTWGAAWQFDGTAHTLTYSLSLNDTPTMQPAWTVDLSNAVRRALTAWSNVANLSFVETGSGGIYDQSPADLAFLLTGNEMQTQMPGLVGLGLPPSPSFADSLLGGASRVDYRQPEGDIAFDNYYSGFSYLDAGGIGLTIMLHEIGHALGLKHTDDAPDGRPTFASLGISNLDSNLYTVMSYTDTANQPFGTNQTYGNAATPMPLDILAIQQIYGANTSYHTGDDSYALGAAPYSTIWDAGGIDTIEAMTAWPGTEGVQIDLRPGGFSGIRANPANAAMGIAYGATIENATGSGGHDYIIGNGAGNVLSGGAANDTLDGGAGIDTLVGETGDDVFVVDDGGDSVIESTNQGWDKVQSSAGSFVLPSNVESLELLGSASIAGTGNSLSNELLGNTGDNVLDGGGAVDVMKGGAGNDVYVVGDASPMSHLWLSSETLVAVNHISSHLYADSSLGSVQTDALYYPWSSRVTVAFHAADSRFDGALTLVTPGLMNTGTYVVGEGSAPYYAGLRYVVSSTGGDATSGTFTILDLSFNGSELVSFAARFDVQMYSRMFSGEVAYNSTALAFTDVVQESPGEGTDTVLASVSYILPDDVENLTLTTSNAIDGTGNVLGNEIAGNIGNNLISGAAGDDQLSGGPGNDTLDGGAGLDTAQYGGPRSEYRVSKIAPGQFTVADVHTANGDDGIDSLSGIERLQFADISLTLQTGGSWHGFKHKPVTPIWAGTDWQVLDSQRDFDGNGKNDVLLHKPDGAVALWLMDGAERIAGAIFDPSPGRTLIDATTDYNADGKTDLGWREADGSNSYWLMGSGWTPSQTTPAVAPPVMPPTEPLSPPPTEPAPPPTAEPPPPPPDGWWY